MNSPPAAVETRTSPQQLVISSFTSKSSITENDESSPLETTKTSSLAEALALTVAELCCDPMTTRRQTNLLDWSNSTINDNRIHSVVKKRKLSASSMFVWPSHTAKEYSTVTTQVQLKDSLSDTVASLASLSKFYPNQCPSQGNNSTSVKILKDDSHKSCNGSVKKHNHKQRFQRQNSIQTLHSPCSSSDHHLDKYNRHYDSAPIIEGTAAAVLALQKENLHSSCGKHSNRLSNCSCDSKNLTSQLHLESIASNKNNHDNEKCSASAISSVSAKSEFEQIAMISNSMLVGLRGDTISNNRDANDSIIHSDMKRNTSYTDEKDVLREKEPVHFSATLATSSAPITFAPEKISSGANAHAMESKKIFPTRYNDGAPIIAGTAAAAMAIATAARIATTVAVADASSSSSNCSLTEEEKMENTNITPGCGNVTPNDASVEITALNIAERDLSTREIREIAAVANNFSIGCSEFLSTNMTVHEATTLSHLKVNSENVSIQKYTPEADAVFWGNRNAMRVTPEEQHQQQIQQTGSLECDSIKDLVCEDYSITVSDENAMTTATAISNNHVFSSFSQNLQQHSSFTKFNSNLRKSRSLNSSGGVGGMDMLADIICHAPPMIVPASPSSATITSSSGAQIETHTIPLLSVDFELFSSQAENLSSATKSCQPFQNITAKNSDMVTKKRMSAIPSFQDIYGEQSAPFHTTTPNIETSSLSKLSTNATTTPHDATIPSNTISHSGTAIPSYQEIYQELGINPKNLGGMSSSFHLSSSVSNEHAKGDHMVKDHPVEEVLHQASIHYHNFSSSCTIETVNLPLHYQDYCINTQKQTSPSGATHYGHALSGGIEEGKELYSRVDLMEMGGHRLEYKDVHGNMKDGADSVVICNLERDIREGDGLCWFLYSCDRINGGGALCRSYHKKRAIRVFRSSTLGGRYAPPYLEKECDGDDIGYRYDGLYMVRAVWDVHGNETEAFPCSTEEGWQTFFFTRLPKKPLDVKSEPGILYNQLGLQELWGSIQKMRGVRRPKKFEIPQAPMKLPPLKRGAITGENKDRKATSFNAHSLTLKDLTPVGKNVEKSIGSCDNEISVDITAKVKSESEYTSSSNELDVDSLSSKVITPRPRLDCITQSKTNTPQTMNQRKRSEPGDISDSSDGATCDSSQKRKRLSSNQESDPISSNQCICSNTLPIVGSALLPKRATAAKAEAANRDMFGKKTKQLCGNKLSSGVILEKKVTKKDQSKEDFVVSNVNIDQGILTVGSRVLVAYKGSPFQATIRKRRKKTDHTFDFLIHYDGNKRSNVHWVSMNQIQQILHVAVDVSPKGNKSIDATGKKGGCNIEKPENMTEYEHDNGEDTTKMDSTTEDVAICESHISIVECSTPQEDCGGEVQPSVETFDDNSSNNYRGDPSEIENQTTCSLNEITSNEKNDSNKSDHDECKSSHVDELELSSLNENPPHDDLSTTSNTTSTIEENHNAPAELASATDVIESISHSSSKVQSIFCFKKSLTLSSIDNDDLCDSSVNVPGCKEICIPSETEDVDSLKTSDTSMVFKFSVGAHVYVEYRSIFYSSIILKSRRKRSCTEYLVHYDGYKKSSDRWVEENDLHDVNEETKVRFEKQRVSSEISVPSSHCHSDLSMTTRGMDLSNNHSNLSTKQKLPNRTKSDRSDTSLLGDIEPGVAFLPGSVVFVELNDSLYLAKMVKKRFSGERMEYLVSYDGFDCRHDGWVSINNIYEVDHLTKRVFNKVNAEIKSGKKPKQPDPPIQNNASARMARDTISIQVHSASKEKNECKKKESDTIVAAHNASISSKRMPPKKQEENSVTTLVQSARSTSIDKVTTLRSQSSQIDMQGIPSGVEFLPGSTLFAEKKGRLHQAKMVKKRGKGEYMEYFIQFNGTKNSESTWISTSLVYEINPQTKRMFRQLQLSNKKTK